MLKLQTALPDSRGIFVSCLTVGLSVFLSVNVSETIRAKATQQSFVLSQRNYCCLPLPLIYFYVHGVFLSAKLVLYELHKYVFSTAFRSNSMFLSIFLLATVPMHVFVCE